MKNIIIYTDGSCDPVRQAGGWAAVILIQGEKIILQGEAVARSHQRMELEAVIHAFKYLVEERITIGSIALYSDSQYVTGIQQRKEKIKKSMFLTGKKSLMRNDDLVASLIGYLDQWDVTLIKIKSHKKNGEGQDINREVDKLSRKIVRRQLTLPK